MVFDNLTSTLRVELPCEIACDFTSRVRSLPEKTLLHVPSSSRLRMIGVVAQCWHGMAQESNEYAQLEEGRSKLLLSPVPHGLAQRPSPEESLAMGGAPLWVVATTR